MIDKLLPKTFDNNFNGNPIAIWLFCAITLMTLGRSTVHIFFADGGAQTIATIPLESYSAEAAATVVSMFAMWGLSQLLLGLIFVLVVIRYRSLIPLMYVLILIEYGGRMAIGIAKPIYTLDTPPGAAANFLLIGFSLLGLVLSLRETKTETT